MIKILISNIFNKGMIRLNTLKTNKHCGKKNQRSELNGKTLSISIPCLYGLRHFIANNITEINLQVQHNLYHTTHKN